MNRGTPIAAVLKVPFPSFFPSLSAPKQKELEHCAEAYGVKVMSVHFFFFPLS